MPPDPSPDAVLVAWARQGDRAAWGELYERYADRLHDYATRLTGSRADAGDCVQDAFVLAVQRIGQLRDPEKVRPWLYAIVRSTAHRHYRRVDRWAFGEVPDAPAAGTGDDAVIAGLTAAEVTELVAEAAAGLTEDDRELLDLSLRHDLVPADVAAALGVSSNHAAVTTERMRERLGRSITVTVLARRPECSDLAALAAKEGPLTPLSRKRLARHVDACATCTAQAERQVRPEALLAIAPLPLLLVPRRAFADFAPEIDAAIEARHRGSAPADGGLEWDADGFPRPPRRRRRRTWLATAAVVGGLLLGAVVVEVARGRGDGDVTATVSGSTNDGGGSADPAGGAAPSGTGTADGGRSDGAPSTDATPSPSLDADPVGAGHEGPTSDTGAPVPADGNSRDDSLPGAASTVPPVPGAPTTTRPPSSTVPSTGPSAGPVTTVPPTGSATTAPAGSTATTAVATTAPAATTTAPASTAPPTTADTTGPAFGAVTGSVSDLTVVSGGSGICKQPPTYTSSYPTTVTVSVPVSDPSGVASVTFTWSSGGASGGGGMAPSGGGWSASIGPLDPSAAPLGGSTGEVTFPLSVTVTATDAGGHTASTTRSGLATVHNCYVIL